MSKRIWAQVRVIEAQNGAPAQFYWSNRWNRVTGIVDSWRESGEWWDGRGRKELLSCLFGIRRMLRAMPRSARPVGAFTSARLASSLLRVGSETAEKIHHIFDYGGNTRATLRPSTRSLAILLSGRSRYLQHTSGSRRRVRYVCNSHNRS